jgi:hypothetical protein
MATHDPFQEFLNKILHGNPPNQDLIDDGVPALRRLFAIAHEDGGSSYVAALFLLGLYDPKRFPFPLTELRMLDHGCFEDVLRVLQMDTLACSHSIEHYFALGAKRFEQLASDWGFIDSSD